MNDICERLIAHWEKSREILPEVFGYDKDKIDEIIDGINDAHQDLIADLRGLCYG